MDFPKDNSQQHLSSGSALWLTDTISKAEAKKILTAETQKAIFWQSPGFKVRTVKSSGLSPKRDPQLLPSQYSTAAANVGRQTTTIIFKKTEKRSLFWFQNSLPKDRSMGLLIIVPNLFLALHWYVPSSMSSGLSIVKRPPVITKRFPGPVSSSVMVSPFPLYQRYSGLGLPSARQSR